MSPKNKFFDCDTREKLADAIQSKLASGGMSVSDIQGAKMLARLRGWDTTPEGPREENPRVEVTPDSQFGRWGYFDGGVEHRGLTADELIEFLGQRRSAVVISTPHGKSWVIDGGVYTLEALAKFDSPESMTR